MNVQLTHLSDTRKVLVITLEPAEVDSEHKSSVDEYVRLARIPGFRPGKAPAAVVTRRFAKEIAEDFKQKVLTRAYRDGLEKEKLEVLSIVTVEEGKIEPGKQADISVTVDVAPVIVLPEYQGIPTEIEEVDPTDADIDRAVEGMRAEKAEFKTAERAAVKGDFVKLAYEGTSGGRSIAEIAPDRKLYAKVPQTWEEVEGEQEGVIPGLGRQLAGLKTGDKKAVAVQFPADFPAVPALAGLAAEYAVEVLEVRERVLPALDEAFLKGQGVESVEALRERVKDGLRRQKELRNRASQRRQVTDALANRVQCTVPESLVESETQGVLRDFIGENMRRGIPADAFEKDKEKLFADAREAASRRIKVQLILGKIAEAEKIEAVDRDLERFIGMEAARSGQSADKLARSLAQDRDRLRSARQSIIFDKTVDFLVAKATVKTIPGGTTPAGATS